MVCSCCESTHLIRYISSIIYDVSWQGCGIWHTTTRLHPKFHINAWKAEQTYSELVWRTLGLKMNIKRDLSFTSLVSSASATDNKPVYSFYNWLRFSAVIIVGQDTLQISNTLQTWTELLVIMFEIMTGQIRLGRLSLQTSSSKSLSGQNLIAWPRAVQVILISKQLPIKQLSIDHTGFQAIIRLISYDASQL
jgi:hypothetical protein